MNVIKIYAGFARAGKKTTCNLIFKLDKNEFQFEWTDQILSCAIFQNQIYNL